ncbi:MAG: electron transfer flavoprotein subunit alpha/FixB family protein [Bacteroidetes bacterium]|nr:electron transfer flavoprotein subunit alpha/FixB family protein [Bacteroidota bacterium]
MSVLVFAENWDGNFKKSTYESVAYASGLAQAVGGTATAVVIGNVSADNLSTLGKYGATKVIQYDGADVNHQAVASILAQAVQAAGAKYVVFNGTWKSKGAAPRLAIKLSASLATEVVELPSSTAPFTVKKKTFSGKAFAHVELSSDVKIIVLSTNSYGVKENAVTAAVEKGSGSASEKDASLQHVEYQKTTGKINLTEAEIVVSAGRGMKGPENWGMVEQLAETLGAATACSKPVADIGWRPHHEHVGQTGIAVAPNLYIAIGISGAIQHLAGISSSKKIVIINTDPEAPFFKAADYGIVGDALQVIPKLTEAIKKLKG